MGRFGALGFVLLCVASPRAVLSQHSDDFEGLNGSPEGIDLNGQGGYYLPPVGGSTAKVYTYDNNVLGIPAHPAGGDQFAGGRGPGNGVYVRSQLDIPYGDGTGAWEIAVDMCHNHDGVVPRNQFIGSFSTQVYPARGVFAMLSSFTDINTATSWDADMLWYDADNIERIEKVGHPAFQNLALNHWYRRSAKVELDTNLILEVSVEDLSTGQKATFQPVDRYGSGGPEGGPAPTGFRLFAGTASPPGNTMVFDNVKVEKERGGGSCCSYAVTSSKEKGGCQTCPRRGESVNSGDNCGRIEDCPKKLKATIDCPDGEGICKIKGKRFNCGGDAPCKKRMLCGYKANLIRTCMNPDQCPITDGAIYTTISCERHGQCEQPVIHVYNCLNDPNRQCAASFQKLEGPCALRELSPIPHPIP